MWLVEKFRWAHLLLVIIVVIQTITLYTEDLNYIILLFLALIPGIVYISVVRYSDVGSREPRGVVAFHILIGTLLIYPAIFLEGIGIGFLKNEGYTPSYSYNLDSVLFWVLFGGIIVAVTEEGLKLLGLTFASFFHSENNEAADSVVYAVAVSGGFALFENYRYVFQILEFSYQDAFITAVARTFTAIPIHLALGLLMGYYLSKYNFSNKLGLSKAEKIINLMKAIIIPIVLHGIYDVAVFLTYANVTLTLSIAVLLSLVYTIYSWKKVKSLRDM